MRPRLFEFARFCLVGFIGYLVDAAALELLVHHGLVAALARPLSIATAMQANYLMHGWFTYRGHGGFSRAGWLRFLSVNLTGAVLNYLVFLLALSQLHFSSPLYNRQLALCCGLGVGMWFNYWGNRRFVFRPKAAPRD